MGFLQDIITEIKNALKWWVVVTPWESGLRVRRGKNIKLLKPGMHWAFPILDRVYVQSIRLRVIDLPVQTVTTLDGKTLTMKGMLGYEIKNIKKLYDKLQHPDDTIVNIATGYVAEYAVTHKSDEFTPRELEKAVLDQLDFSQYGLGSVQLRITDFAYVKTYRLIQGDSWYSSGDRLSTSEAINQ